MNLENLIAEVKKSYSNENDLEQIRKAFELANELHKDQKRQSGEPYISILSL